MQPSMLIRCVGGLSTNKKVNERWYGSHGTTLTETLRNNPADDSTVVRRSRARRNCQRATQALGFQSIARDLGFHVRLNILTDATAAIGIVRRRGLGRIRYLDVSDLWVKDKMNSGATRLCKIQGALNPADMCTKHVERAIIQEHLPRLNLQSEHGRADSAPNLQH